MFKADGSTNSENLSDVSIKSDGSGELEPLLC